MAELVFFIYTFKVNYIFLLLIILQNLKKVVDYAKYLNKIYVDNEKWDEFLSKRDNMITYQNVDLNKDFHCPTVLDLIESDSLKKEACKLLTDKDKSLINYTNVLQFF